jgi:hypothetical protein
MSLITEAEMSLNLDTMLGSIEPDFPEKLFFGVIGYRSTRENFVVDGTKLVLALTVALTPLKLSPAGIDITANRLFGPQPRTSTYICVWEICLGHIKAVLSASEGRILAAAGTSFRLNFLDMANAPASEYAIPMEPDGE